MSRDPKLEIVESTYDFEQDRAPWLGELASRLGRITGAVSGYVFELTRVDGRPTAGDYWFEDPRLVPAMLRSWAELSPEQAEMFTGPPMKAQTSAEVLRDHGIPFEASPLPELYASIGIADVLAVHAVAPSGRGLILGMCLEHQCEFDRAERDAWAHVAAHVSAGLRLRQRLGSASPIDHADAVLRPDGKLEHLLDDGIGDLLREAVLQVERARSRKTDTHEALALWRGLVDGRWSLLDHHEGGGQRYYVAVRNSPEAAKGRGLTRREAEIVAYVASGTTTKATAYALGLDAVTVRCHLRAALAKLGLGSRAELIGLRTTLLGGDPDQRSLDS